MDHQKLAQHKETTAESVQETKLYSNFSEVLVEVLKEHKRIYRYQYGWKLLLGKDPELEKIFYEIAIDRVPYKNNRYHLIFSDGKRRLKELRMQFISMLQVEFPSLPKTKLFSLLKIEDVEKFI